jgi:hypothetical protein
MLRKPQRCLGRRTDPKKGTERKIPKHKITGKTKNQKGGCCAEGRITDIRDARMEEKSGKQGRMKATFEGGQGPEGAVVPWMDGRNDVIKYIIYLIGKQRGRIV